MNMKEHILAALREKFEQWEELLASLSEQQITTPLQPSHWSVKDEIAHLRAWQQRTIARMEGALAERAPVFPQWAPGLDPEAEDSTEAINAWIYEAARDQSWAEVHGNWKEGFLRLLDLGGKIPESNLLAGGLYAWLRGYSLALYLLATYDHHQEHYEKLAASLQKNK